MKKYILVDAEKIEVTKREVKRVSGFNDFWNEYEPVGVVQATEIFNEQGVPQQFQKIALRLPGVFQRNQGQEVLTGRSFSIVKLRRSNEYDIVEFPRYYSGDVIGSSIYSTSPTDTSSYDDVLSFYNQLAENGYLEQYVESIKNMFYVPHELKFDGEPTKVEDRAKELVKTGAKKKKI